MTNCEGYFVPTPLVMTIAQLHQRANEFSARTLYSVGLLVEQYHQGQLSAGQFDEGVAQVAATTSEPRLLCAYALYHPTNRIPDKEIIIQI